MQSVIDQCSMQMQDFDQINKMSTQLIEQLQNEVDYYKGIGGGYFQSQGNMKDSAVKDYTF